MSISDQYSFFEFCAQTDWHTETKTDARGNNTCFAQRIWCAGNTVTTASRQPYTNVLCLCQRAYDWYTSILHHKHGIHKNKTSVTTRVLNKTTILRRIVEW